MYLMISVLMMILGIALFVIGGKTKITLAVKMAGIVLTITGLVLLCLLLSGILVLPLSSAS